MTGGGRRAARNSVRRSSVLNRTDGGRDVGNSSHGDRPVSRRASPVARCLRRRPPARRARQLLRERRRGRARPLQRREHARPRLPPAPSARGLRPSHRDDGQRRLQAHARGLCIHARGGVVIALQPASRRPGLCVDSKAAGQNLMTRPVLIVEDDPDIAEGLKYNLEREGLETRVALTGEQGLQAALDQKNPPALVILDLMLPGMSGTDLCRRLRREPQTRRTPIIMLTARTSEADPVAGLDLGADDYISKPFSVRELLARVRAVLRRADESASARYEDARLSVDFDDMRATCDGASVRLTRKEFSLLTTLVRAAGRVATRQQLHPTAPQSPPHTKFPPPPPPRSAPRAASPRASNCSTRSGATTTTA